MSRTRFPLLPALAPILVLAFAAATPARDARAGDDYNQAPIHYESERVDNAIDRLQRKLDSGKATLKYDAKFGYLPAVLAALGVDPATQALVFSRTSFQQRIISPENPRALYFNDDVYLGWVPGSDMLEASAVDREKGTVFYTLSQAAFGKPQFARRNHECLQCHQSALTHGIPGHVVRSVFPDAKGFPLLRHGTFAIDDSSPVEQRWGGWFVTGDLGGAQHLGNTIFQDTVDPQNPSGYANPNGVPLALTAPPVQNSLDTRLAANKYVAPGSDVVALMVLEHQTKMHNLITVANFQTREALHHDTVMRELLEEKGSGLMASTRSRIDSAVKPLLAYMLFDEEVKLQAPITGSSAFTTNFQKGGKRDQLGRSLRQLDLKTRLFRYPCSYLIHSDAFDALPKEALAVIYQRLWDTLNAQPTASARVSAPERKAILEILRDTKPGLPDYWRATRLSASPPAP